MRVLASVSMKGEDVSKHDPVIIGELAMGSHSYKFLVLVYKESRTAQLPD